MTFKNWQALSFLDRFSVWQLTGSGHSTRRGQYESRVTANLEKPSDITTLVRPSFGTFTCDAFSWHVAPWLKDDRKQELQSLWTALEDFDPKMPNRDLSDPELPAEPEGLERGQWKWKDCYQPLRWFFCPCMLRKHGCAFTGDLPMSCRGWHAVCCQEVCTTLYCVVR